MTVAFTNSQNYADSLQSFDKWKNVIREHSQNSREQFDLAVKSIRNVDITSAHPSGISMLLSGKVVKLSSLFRTDESFRVAYARIQRHIEVSAELASKSIAALSYIGYGIANTDDEQFPLKTPAFRRHVSITHSVSREDYDLQLDNLLEVPSELSDLLNLNNSQVRLSATTNFDVDSAIERLAQVGQKSFPNFTISKERIITLMNPWSFAEMVDFEHLEQDALKSDLVMALAGSKPHQETVSDDAKAKFLSAMGASMSAISTNAKNPKDITPANEIGIGDLTANERSLVNLYDSGASFFVDAPIGSDPSGQIAALIAQSACRGERVLHIAGGAKQCHLVQEDLAQNGLPNLILDANPRFMFKEDITKSFKKALQNASTFDTEGVDLSITAKLFQNRANLTGMVNALHQKREPWGVSLFETMSNLSRFNRKVYNSDVILSRDTAANISGELNANAQKLIEFRQLDDDMRNGGYSAFSGAKIETHSEAADTLDRLERLMDITLPQLVNTSNTIGEEAGFIPANTVREWAAQLSLLEQVRKTFDIFVSDVFERDLEKLVSALSQTSKTNEKLAFLEKKRLEKDAKALVRPGIRINNLVEELAQIIEQREQYTFFSTQSGGTVVSENTIFTQHQKVKLPNNVLSALSTVKSLQYDLQQLNEIINTTSAGIDRANRGIGLEDISFDELNALVYDLWKEKDGLIKLPEQFHLLNAIEAAGLDSVSADLGARNVVLENIADELEYIWWKSVYKYMLEADPLLENFDVEVLEQLVEEFSALDAKHVSMLSAPVQLVITVAMQGLLDANIKEAIELEALLDEGEFSDIADIFQKFRNVAPAIFSAISTTPNILPQIVPPGEVLFDTLILDSIENVDLAHIITSVLRAKRVVVIADSRRGGEAVQKFFGILPTFSLDIKQSLRDLRLTLLLRENGYSDVIDFENVIDIENRVQYCYIEKGGALPSKETDEILSTQAEVKYILEILLDYAKTYENALVRGKKRRLNIIALNGTHSTKIREYIRKASVKDPKVMRAMMQLDKVATVDISDIESGVFSPADDVIIACGFGKTPHHKMIYEYGPLRQKYAVPGLLSAIGSVGDSLIVVSAIDPSDIDRARLKTAGEKLYLELLNLAKESANSGLDLDGLRNILGIESVVLDRIRVNKHHYESYTVRANSLIDILAGKLSARGLDVELDYNFTHDGLRAIPLVVRGKNPVAVLTDDNNYISTHSLRTRDRKRIAELENLGWNVVFCWSYGIFTDSDREVSKILAAVGE